MNFALNFQRNIFSIKYQVISKVKDTYKKKYIFKYFKINF